MQQETLLIPAMLDAHFPLLQYAFLSRRYRPVILDNDDGITDLGLRYVHNDMCYPCILNTGQMLDALRSGQYDLQHTKLLMPSAGDACRGSNYTEVLRKAVRKAGFPQVPVLTLNLKGIDKENQLPVSPAAVWRALFGLFYGDLLMILTQQVRPYEKRTGETERCRDHWNKVLADELLHLRNMTFSDLLRRFRTITEDFSRIPVTGENKQRIAIVGELYTKYCSLGNWDMVQYLERNGCESFTNGLSWYVLYYIDSHLAHGTPAEVLGYRAVGAVLARLQDKMVSVLREFGYFTLPPLRILKQEAADVMRFEAAIGDGWLIGTESAGYIRHGCPKVLAIQPFGCMPNHVSGRGQYASLARRLGGMIVSVDVDSGSAKVNAYNRAKMLIDAKPEDFRR